MGYVFSFSTGLLEMKGEKKDSEKARVACGNIYTSTFYSLFFVCEAF